MLMVLLEADRRIGECLEVEEIDQEVDLEREQEKMELCRSLDFPRWLKNLFHPAVIQRVDCQVQKRRIEAELVPAVVTDDQVADSRAEENLVQGRHSELARCRMLMVALSRAALGVGQEQGLDQRELRKNHL